MARTPSIQKKLQIERLPEFLQARLHAAESHLTLSSLARAAKVPASTLSRVMAGTQGVSELTARNLATALGLKESERVEFFTRIVGYPHLADRASVAMDAHTTERALDFPGFLSRTGESSQLALYTPPTFDDAANVISFIEHLWQGKIGVCLFVDAGRWEFARDIAERLRRNAAPPATTSYADEPGGWISMRYSFKLVHQYLTVMDQTLAIVNPATTGSPCARVYRVDFDGIASKFTKIDPRNGLSRWLSYLKDEYAYKSLEELLAFEETLDKDDEVLVYTKELSEAYAVYDFLFQIVKRNVVKGVKYTYFCAPDSKQQRDHERLKEKLNSDYLNIVPIDEKAALTLRPCTVYVARSKRRDHSFTETSLPLSTPPLARFTEDDAQVREQTTKTLRDLAHSHLTYRPTAPTRSKAT